MCAAGFQEGVREDSHGVLSSATGSVLAAVRLVWVFRIFGAGARGRDSSGGTDLGVSFCSYLWIPEWGFITVRLSKCSALMRMLSTILAWMVLAWVGRRGRVDPAGKVDRY